MINQETPGVFSDSHKKPVSGNESQRDSRKQTSSRKSSFPKKRRSMNPFQFGKRFDSSAQNPLSVENSVPAVEAVEESAVPQVSSFAEFNFDPRIQRAITEAGYETPTPVQAATIPAILAGRDIIGTAQTGTGKTAAFVLPILQHILDNPTEKRCTRAIIITPTRELAEQIHDSFSQLGKYTRIKSATVYGGVGMFPQERALRQGADVIVACPGRLIDHMERRNTNFARVETLVLDEADRMLDMGFLPPIKRILSQLPSNRQSMLFSATFAPELTNLAESTMNSPERISIGLRTPAKTVQHALYPCPQHLKTSLVISILQNADPSSVLIFTRTKHRADKVAQQMSKTGFKTAARHADKSQSQRQAALNDFKSGRCQVLVATDIAARGLDVETVSHVINYDVPDCADTYIHRIGRTGRAERKGDAITLITREDAGIVWDIEKAFGSPIVRRKVEDFDYTAAGPQIGLLSPAPGDTQEKTTVQSAGHSVQQPAVKVYATKRRSKFRRSSV
ncbi:MAG TPA: DEAD/DEAH box helicase [Armatimonadota bacterium]